MNQMISTLLVCTQFVFVGSAFAQGSPVSLQNSAFQDADSNGQPKHWQPYPPGNGESSKIEMAADGGLHILDTDAGSAAGVLQWVPVKAGMKYQATVQSEGSGGCFLYMIFSPKIPAKASDLSKIKLSETREWIKAGEKSMEVTAPAGSEYLQLWIYSPQGNTNCDLVVKNVSLQSLGEAKMSSTTPESPARAVSTTADLENVFFQDTDGDGMPDGWSAFPSGNGQSTKIEMTAKGVHLLDTDARKGLGIQQWVPVTPGTKYRTVVHPEGSGGCFLYMTFSSKIPAKASDLKMLTLSDKREWLSAGKEKSMEMTAPAGASFLQLWIYSPNDNVKCDLVFKEISLMKAGKAEEAPAAPPPPPPGAASYPHYNAGSILPVGQLSVIDFETGDLSQIRTKEGGKKEVVESPEPVRNGKHAMKIQMDHDNERSEITGYRSAESGEYKYGWSIFIPEDFDGKTSFSIVTQWHDWGSGKEYIEDGGPPTSMYIANDIWRLKIRFQDGIEGNKLTKKEFTFGSIDADRGKWTDFVVEVNWQSPKSGGGYFYLYKNGEKVVDYEGPTWYEEKVQGPFFKMGIYKGAGSWKGEASNTYMYFDEFRMGDKSVSKDQVDPAKQPGS